MGREGSNNPNLIPIYFRVGVYSDAFRLYYAI